MSPIDNTHAANTNTDVSLQQIHSPLEKANANMSRTQVGSKIRISGMTRNQREEVLNPVRRSVQPSNLGRNKRDKYKGTTTKESLMERYWDA